MFLVKGPERFELIDRCLDHYIETLGQPEKHGENHPYSQTEQCSGKSGIYPAGLCPPIIACQDSLADYIIRNILPGFGTAVVTFSLYVFYDEFIGKKKAAHGAGHAEGSAHH